MPTDNEDLEVLLVAFLEGDLAARRELPARSSALVQAIARRLAPTYFAAASLLDDVVSRSWEILLKRPADAFDPGRGTAMAYLATIVRTAVRDVRQESAWVVAKSRDYTEPDETIDYVRVPPIDEASEDPDLCPVDSQDGLQRLLTSEPAGFATAVRAIAFEDAALGDAAIAGGMTRFALKRSLVSWATRAELRTAA